MFLHKKKSESVVSVLGKSEGRQALRSTKRGCLIRKTRQEPSSQTFETTAIKGIPETLGPLVPKISINGLKSVQSSCQKRVETHDLICADRKGSSQRSQLHKLAPNPTSCVLKISRPKQPSSYYQFINPSHPNGSIRSKQKPY